MKSIFSKKARIASFLLAFGLLATSVLSLTSAVDASAVSSSSQPWSTSTDSSKIYCDTDPGQLFPAICTGTKPALLNASTDRYIDITLHAGEYGHFEGGAKDYTATYFYNDTFDDRTQPISERASYAFVGWSTDPAATAVDVELGELKAIEVGTDLYAVWSDKAYVLYLIYGGVWDSPDGNEYTQILMEYDVNTNFQPLSPAPRRIEPYYDFVGWTTQSYGGGEQYTASTPITNYWTEIYSAWQYNPAKVANEMILNEVYDITAGVAVPLYKFTPTEDGWYEVYTDGITVEPNDERQAMLRLLDQDDHTLKSEQYIDPAGGDVHLYYEMTAGTTYYIRLGEYSGMYLRFNAGVRKAETATVTFDAGGTNGWFDDGGSHASIKDVITPIGDNVANLRFSDLITDDVSTFNAWVAEPGGEVHSHLLVTGPMTVYADYQEMTAIQLDYNGGHDPFTPETTSYLAKFKPDQQFETPVDPKIDDPTKKFVGWSVDSNADTPSPEVIEGKNSAANLANWLNGRTLYAVYGEKVSVTFRATGGSWMMDDMSTISYENSLGKGHIFYGMAVMHYHPQVEHFGWIDQDGTTIAATSGVDGTYHVDKDSAFTSILKYKMTAYGNGGIFPNAGLIGAEVATLRLGYNGWQTTFSYAEALEVLGNPVPDDESKQFIGFATDPDATEPNIIDGETYLEDISRIYAIWGDAVPEPSDDPAEDEEAPAVPNTGANSSADAGSATSVNYLSLASLALAVISFVAYFILRRRHV